MTRVYLAQSSNKFVKTGRGRATKNRVEISLRASSLFCKKSRESARFLAVRFSRHSKWTACSRASEKKANWNETISPTPSSVWTFLRFFTRRGIFFLIRSCDVSFPCSVWNNKTAFDLNKGASVTPTQYGCVSVPRSFRYKLERWNWTKISITSSIACVWTGKRFGWIFFVP